MISIIVSLLCTLLFVIRFGMTVNAAVVFIVTMLTALAVNYLLRPKTEEKFKRADFSIVDSFELDPLTMDEKGNCTYLRFGKTKGGCPTITFRSKAHNDPVSRLRTIPGQDVEFVYDQNPSIVLFIAKKYSRKDLLISIFKRKAVKGRIELHTPELLSLLVKEAKGNVK